MSVIFCKYQCISHYNRRLRRTRSRRLLWSGRHGRTGTERRTQLPEPRRTCNDAPWWSTAATAAAAGPESDGGVVRHRSVSGRSRLCGSSGQACSNNSSRTRGLDCCVVAASPIMYSRKWRNYIWTKIPRDAYRLHV